MQAYLTELDEGLLHSVVSSDVIYILGTPGLYIDDAFWCRLVDFFGLDKVKRTVKAIEREFADLVEAKQFNRIPSNLGLYLIGRLFRFADVTMLFGFRQPSVSDMEGARKQRVEDAQGPKEASKPKRRRKPRVARGTQPTAA